MSDEQKTLALSEVKVLVVGDNWYWGKGDTIEEARKNARNPRHYAMFLVHPEAIVNGMGYIQSPNGYEPKKIHAPRQKRHKAVIATEVNG